MEKWVKMNVKNKIIGTKDEKELIRKKFFFLQTFFFSSTDRFFFKILHVHRQTVTFFDRIKAMCFSRREIIFPRSKFLIHKRWELTIKPLTVSNLKNNKHPKVYGFPREGFQTPQKFWGFAAVLNSLKQKLLENLRNIFELSYLLFRRPWLSRVYKEIKVVGKSWERLRFPTSIFLMGPTIKKHF